MRNPEIDWWLVGACAAVLAASSGVYYAFRERSHDPDEAERRRRSRLSQTGRIAEGRIIEFLELPPAPAPSRKSFSLFRKSAAATGGAANGGRKLVRYSYSISGVTYETAQDVTGLEARACLQRVVAGQPASVKYEPSNPTNSILVADDWSGLH